MDNDQFPDFEFYPKVLSKIRKLSPSDSLILSAGNGFIRLVLYFINQEGITLEDKNRAALEASQEGYLDVFQALLDNGCSLDYEDGLHLNKAADQGHLKLIRFLLDRGILASIRDDAPVYYACDRGGSDTVQLLLQEFPRHLIQFGLGHFDCAPKVLAVLLEWDSVLPEPDRLWKPEDLNIILYMAAQGACLESVQILIRFGAQVEYLKKTLNLEDLSVPIQDFLNDL